MTLQKLSPRMCTMFFACLFTALASATARAQATTVTTNENIPFTGNYFNQCNGDTVTYSGTLHVSNTYVTDADGGTHLRTHLNYQDVTGTGAPSGAQYRVGTVSNEVVNDSSSPQSNYTVITTVKLIAPGPVLDYFMRTVIRVVVNANGETTSTVQEVSFECRGRA